MTTNVLGEYIKRLREQRGWSQRDLEKRSGVKQATISKVERGHTLSPGMDFLVAISKAFKVPESKLILAYKGIDPDLEQNTAGISSDEALQKLATEAAMYALKQQRGE